MVIFFRVPLRGTLLSAPTRIDPLRLKAAIQLACLQDYVNALPNGLHTAVGAEGQGLSGGQKQRVLLARSIYRMPDFLFLDEATSALDARTETAVYRALREFAVVAPSSSSHTGSAPSARPTKSSCSTAATLSNLERTANSSRKKAPIFSSFATNWRSKQARHSDRYSSGPIGDRITICACSHSDTSIRNTAATELLAGDTALLIVNGHFTLRGSFQVQQAR